MGMLFGFLAWARGLAVVAKLFALFTPFAALIPGGSLITGALSAGGSIFAGLWAIVKWCFEGVQTVIAHPAALSACLMCGLGGVYGGVKYTHERVVVAEEATTRALATVRETQRKLTVAVDENSGWRARYDDEQKRAEAAEAAREDAIRKALETAKPASPAPADAARRLRPGASAPSKPAASKSAAGGVFDLPSLQWPFK